MRAAAGAYQFLWSVVPPTPVKRVRSAERHCSLCFTASGTVLRMLPPASGPGPRQRGPV